MSKLCEAHPELSGALFLSLRVQKGSTDCFASIAMTEKSGTGARIRGQNIYL